MARGRNKHEVVAHQFESVLVGTERLLYGTQARDNLFATHFVYDILDARWVATITVAGLLAMPSKLLRQSVCRHNVSIFKLAIVFAGLLHGIVGEVDVGLVQVTFVKAEVFGAGPHVALAKDICLPIVAYQNPNTKVKFASTE